MLYRIIQFFYSLTARITPEDKVFVENYLSVPERQLFDRLNASTRKHSINVARAAVKAADENLTAFDESIIIKAALLHDIGKSCASHNVIIKSFYVLLKKFFPMYVAHLKSRPARGPFAGFVEAIYVAENHARIGAALAEEQGLDKILIEVIAHHHDKPSGPLVKLIHDADNLY